MPSLVTGSSGVLGACLVDRLLARGERLLLLDLVPPPDDSSQGHAAAEFIKADLRDRRAFAAACRGMDVVYHLAAGQRMKPQFAAMSERAVYEMNVSAVESAVEGALEAGVRKLVFVSSSGVYGIPRMVPCSEDHPQRPLGAYGRSKIEAERICLEAVGRGLDVTILRPMSLFGPRMTGVFLILFDWVRRGKRVYLLGNGSNRIQMASAWDVAEACILAARRPEGRGAILNIGADEVPTVREQVEALISYAGSSSSIAAIPAAPLRMVSRLLHPLGLSPIVPEHYLLADSTFILDTTRAKQLLGWKPAYSNLEMTIEAYQWYCDKGCPPAQGPVLKLLNALS